MLKEMHSIKPFRGGDLGIIRLDKLAYPEKERIKIWIENTEIKPIGFDTYGHPIISKDNFAYYKALKSITERKGENLIPVVEYESKPFCIRREVYDSADGIEKSLKSLKDFKKMLIFRKQAAFCGYELDVFVIEDMYILKENGHVYECEHMQTKALSKEKVSKKVLGMEDIETLIVGKELHIPSEQDSCAICGRSFSIGDIEEFAVSENEECAKVHSECLKNYYEAVNYERASKIIDAVYTDKKKPTSEVSEIYDSEDNEMKTCYVYKTNQGTITIYFRTKVTIILWHDNFKPFNMSIFDNERVTKFDRGIHAWSMDDAIKYLQMAKKA